MNKEIKLALKILLLAVLTVASLFGTVTALSENDVIMPEGTPLAYLDLSRFYAKKVFTPPPITFVTPTDLSSSTDVQNAVAAAPVHPPVPVSLEGDVGEQLKAISNKYGCVCAQIAVIDDGYVSSVFSCGLADRERYRPVDDNTKIRVASLSKVLVGMAAMKAQEEGVFDLDDPLTDIVGFRVRNPHYTRCVLTMRSFLTHTATVNMYSEISGMSLDAFLRTPEIYIFAEPNTAEAWCYSNPGIRAAGGMLEVILNRTLPDYTEEKLLDPLGADASFFASRLDDKSNIAALYGGDLYATQTVDALLWKPYYTTPGANSYIFAGGLVTSAQDYAKLMCVLLRNGEYDGMQLLSQQSVAEMEQPNFVVNGFDQCVILRHRGGMYNGRELYYHTGDAYGVLAFASYDRASGEGVVIVTVGATSGRDGYDVPEVCGEFAEYIYSQVLDGKRA